MLCLRMWVNLAAALAARAPTEVNLIQRPVFVYLRTADLWVDRETTGSGSEAYSVVLCTMRSTLASLPLPVCP